MARKGKYTYNPQTKKWTKTTNSKSSSSKKSSSKKSSLKRSSSKKKNKSSSKKKGSGNLSGSGKSKNTSSGSATKKYNNIEVNTLQGQLNYIVTEETIKLKSGDTVQLKGLGKFLSGKYYVKEVNRLLSSQGYSHSAVLIKTDFGDSLKEVKTTTKTKSCSKTSGTGSKKVSTNSKKRKHKVKKGESLYSIAKKYYKKGSKWKKIYNANKKKIGKNKGKKKKLKKGMVLIIP